MKENLGKVGWVSCVIAVIFLVMAGLVMAQDKLQIGVVTTFGGAYAAMGTDAARAIQFVEEETKKKVLNKSLEIIAVDDENKPAVGARKVRELLESKKIKFFNGANSSAVGLAIAQVANETKSIWVTSVGADDITGAQCNRYTFRWSVPTYGAVRETVIPLIKKFPEAKRWYTITPDYVFGHSLLNNAKEAFKMHGIDHVGNDMHPIGTTEFSSFLTKAMAAKADVVVFFNFGKDTINALKQANNFGLNKKAKLLVAWSSGFHDLLEIGSEVAEGVYFGCQFWHEVDVPRTQAFVKAWQAKFKVVPSYPEASTYSMFKMTLMGIEKANSTNPEAVAKTMEGMKWDGLTGEEFIQAFDHQTNKNYYLLQGKAKKDMKNPYDLASVISFGRSFKPQAESDCKMK